ncbi:hypothetical protein BKA64DRAFT_58309 [Cadophora sp. MPI-SDFR-AT-0126]|nr:hypothetical protein BKA64DRAFT_58309 [Leotiomycetes sp. MPI-SDFR-AT-0126]
MGVINQCGIVAADRCHQSQSLATSTHQVQFYEGEEYLYHVLSDFFVPFLSYDESSVGAIVLARKRTIEYLEDFFVAREYTCDGAGDSEEHRPKATGGDSVTSLSHVYKRGQRSVLLVDANELLARIVPKDEVNAQVFNETVIKLLSQIHPGGATGLLEPGDENLQHTYAYGELVDLLCARGQHLLALELETLWNRLLSSYNISLLCGYKMDSFRGPSDENVFAQICHSHVAVTPTESYSNLTTSKQKSAMIAVLQQQLTALRATGQLHWSNRDAEQRIRYREQFVDVLCHELRNPVSGIIGNIELLQIGLEVRQDIIDPHREGNCNGETRLSAMDVASLQSQLTEDIISVDAIAVCAEHMKVVTDDVLSLSKLDEGKVVLEHVPLDLNATVSSVIKMFSTAAQTKGVELFANLPSGDLHVLGDQGRIAQVLVNLVSNAIKFTDMGCVIVELTRLGQTLPGSHEPSFQISVRDTGCGLEAAEISLLFQRFAQPISTSFAKHGGTGLGLYISKHLVELMGGLVNVESQKGKGSTFSFTFQAQPCPVTRLTLRQLGNKAHLDDCVVKSPFSLPAASIIHSPNQTQGGGADNQEVCFPTSPPAVSISTPTTRESISTRLYDLGVRHVLVVDDNPIIVRTLTRMLDNGGGSGPSISVNTACNGYDAISNLIMLSTSSSPIDLILMDLEMPFLNGINTAREIRRFKDPARAEGHSLAQRKEAERLADTLIIGLTADVRETRFIEARKGGMDECIGKPVVKETLYRLIQEARGKMATNF